MLLETLSAQKAAERARVGPTPATSRCTCGTRSRWSATGRVRRPETSRGSDLLEPPASSDRTRLLNTAGGEKRLV